VNPPTFAKPETSLGRCICDTRARPKKAQSQRARPTPDAVKAIIDGAERRWQRPKQAEKQALHYSSKRKIHSVKNDIIVTAKRKRVSYLGQPCPCKTHDKKVADTETISCPKHITRKKT
jgi:hypothetical protein